MPGRLAGQLAGQHATPPTQPLPPARHTLVSTPVLSHLCRHFTQTVQKFRFAWWLSLRQAAQHPPPTCLLAIVAPRPAACTCTCSHRPHCTGPLPCGRLCNIAPAQALMTGTILPAPLSFIFCTPHAEAGPDVAAPRCQLPLCITPLLLAHSLIDPDGMLGTWTPMAIEDRPPGHEETAPRSPPEPGQAGRSLTSTPARLHGSHCSQVAGTLQTAGAAGKGGRQRALPSGKKCDIPVCKKTV